MLFTAPVFLFGFLPLVLAGFWLTPRRIRNLFLLAASIGFYAWSERRYVWFLIGSILVNTAFGLLVERSEQRVRRRAWLSVAVLINLSALVYFKYFNFLLENVIWVSDKLGWRAPEALPIHLPIAISFITFEALSYVIDVYRGETKARTNPVHVGLYVSVFPHLIAGPILRFDDIAPALERPTANLDRFGSGAQLFITGLAKKVLIANTVGKTADQLFATPDSLSAGAAWLGIVCYSLQIYFDFSGYSDMAIGLGRLFGFELPKNFDRPYASRSIKEFWRRWHISLSTWFRDYLYIPLGGNRHGELRSYLNSLIVFFLCGLWHGASWTFVVWGLYHGVFLVLERTGFGRLLDHSWRPVQHAYALIVVMIGWVFFRAENMDQAWRFLGAMAGRAEQPAIYLGDLLSRELMTAALVGCIVATLPLAIWSERLGRWREQRRGAALASGLVSLAVHAAILVASFVSLAAATHHPFIYFRF